MGDNYRYPVFFECRSLGREEIKRIENYFRIRRRSGGGDCGPLRRVNDTTYSVAFKQQRDQQAVLQRSEHVVELADGPLVFTVRSSLEPHASSPSTPQSIPASTPPPGGEEYELQLDFYLIRYLKECPKAGKELEEKLASMACSAQLYPDEERVLVRTIVQPGAVDEVTMWKAEVKKLFDGYLCHYEFDPHRVKALLQSCSSHQTTDEVKVYSEIGMAVVVGEHSQVKARLMDVKDRSDLFKKDTCIHRIGKAKLRLLWKEIENSLGRDFPGVKITQGEAGQLVLEGSAKELVKAGDWISDKEKLVFEKTVSDMSPHVLAFLKKAYGGPGELSDFLQVGDKVEVELRDTELHFFTLSTDNFDEIEKALQDVIKEVIINVPNSSAVPSELQEKLKSMTNEMNQEQYRAQVVFGSDSTVCLVGHSKEVDELSDAVAQFILDQSDLQNIVHLLSPNLAQELPELLQEGPSNKVTEVRNRLGPFLDSSLQDPTGKDELLTVPQNLACLSLSEVNTTVARYSLCDGLQVQVCQGDITELEADALVNAANEDLDHCGGVAAALSKAGGPEVQKESNALVKHTGKIPAGDVVVTAGGNLKCKKLLHAVGPICGKEGGRERIILEQTVHSALNLAEMMEFESIAMPCISSGAFGVPVDVCSEAIVTAVKGFCSQGGRSLSRIILIDNRGEVVRAMQATCDRLLQSITTGNTAPSELGFPMDAAAQDTARGATAGAPGNVVHVETIQESNETQQVLKSVQEDFQLKKITNDVHQQDQVWTGKRIVLLGKTGSGKSNLANTIFGEELFTTNYSPDSGTKKCQAETKSVNGRRITLIDTPGFFDAERSEEEMKPEIVKCITECAPGPHAFLIVLKVERFTEHEQAVITKIFQYFSEDALKYAVIVFTHGDQLPKGIKIEEFVGQKKNLSDLVKKCGGRCHVIDNKYWKNRQQNEYRSNLFQVEELLSTIDKMVIENNGDYYTNDFFQDVEKEIQKEEENIKQSSVNMPVKEIRQQAKSRFSLRFLIQLVGTATGVLIGAFFGVNPNQKPTKFMKHLKTVPAVGGAVAAVGETAVLRAAVTTLGATAVGGMIGGAVGYDAAEKAETVLEAAQMAANAVSTVYRN